MLDPRRQNIDVVILSADCPGSQKRPALLLTLLPPLAPRFFSLTRNATSLPSTMYATTPNSLNNLYQTFTLVESGHLIRQVFLGKLHAFLLLSFPSFLFLSVLCKHCLSLLAPRSLSLSLSLSQAHQAWLWLWPCLDARAHCFGWSGLRVPGVGAPLVRKRQGERRSNNNAFVLTLLHRQPGREQTATRQSDQSDDARRLRYLFFPLLSYLDMMCCIGLWSA